VSIWISHRKLAQSPRLINGCGVNWRLWALRRIQTPRTKGHVTLIDVINKHSVDGTEDIVSRMM
jgi:hypothetical protein